MQGQQSPVGAPASVEPAAEHDRVRDAEQAEKERAQPTVSESGGFANDPDDASNPNEVIERHRRKLRP